MLKFEQKLVRLHKVWISVVQDWSLSLDCGRSVTQRSKFKQPVPKRFCPDFEQNRLGTGFVWISDVQTTMIVQISDRKNVQNLN